MNNVGSHLTYLSRVLSMTYHIFVNKVRGYGEGVKKAVEQGGGVPLDN